MSVISTPISSADAVCAEIDRIYESLSETGSDATESSSKTEYMFDACARKLFRRSLSRKRLNSFGIYYKSRLSLIRRYGRPFRTTYIDFHDCIHSEVLTVNADVINFAPRFHEGGSQIKVVDFTGRQALCIPASADSQWLAQNELVAYTTFQEHPLIPRLVRTLDNGIYIRNLIEGQILTTSVTNWTQVVSDCLASLAEIYEHNPIRELPLDEYLHDIGSRVSPNESSDNDLHSMVHMLDRIAIRNHPEICQLARVHGDFARKNIIVRPSHAPTLIDWERHCERSITYDLCNFIFKLDHWNDVAVTEFLRGVHDSRLSDWRRVLIEKFGASSSYESFIGEYALFLLERLDLEVRIHGSFGHVRTQNFIRIWRPHVQTFLSMVR